MQSRVVKTRIIKLGKSYGVRIPKRLLDQAGLHDEVVLEVIGNAIIVRSTARPHPREGWEEQARLMAEREEDRLDDWEVTDLDAWNAKEKV